MRSFNWKLGVDQSAQISIFHDRPSNIQISIFHDRPSNIKQQLLNHSVEEIRNALGEAVCFQQKRERHYIDEREKDAMLHDLMDSFIKSTLNYFSQPDFPEKYVLKEFQAHRKQQAWRQHDHRG
jgi:hypothetical protein